MLEKDFMGFSFTRDDRKLIKSRMATQKCVTMGECEWSFGHDSLFNSTTLFHFNDIE